jgi:glycosyltransferase involved in cell wall biosynthesis
LAAQHYLRQIGTSEEWFSRIIKSWRPDLIHTLGLEPASYYYYDVRKKYNLEAIGKWIVQVRGGPDLALNRLLPEFSQKIRSVFRECDQVIADNRQNYEYALEMGLPRDRICDLGALPGSGGIDVERLKSQWQEPPSARERIIVWPKAYECPQSKALPVFEALKLAWSWLAPCKICMFAADQETMLWFQALPQSIKDSSCISYRVPRDEVLASIVRARVMLAPSILDGVPNSLYEAMAGGAFPIVSPLETITPIVREGENVLFARNLYPEEIAAALVRAMSDDALVDQASRNNSTLVSQVANRASIIPKITGYYDRLSASKAR